MAGHNDGYLNHATSGAEDVLIKLSKQIIKPNSIILDIGANLGITSAIFAVTVKDALIYSFEPGPMNYAYLKNNMAENDFNNVLPIWMAVGNSNSEMSFHENSAWGYIDTVGVFGGGSTSVTVTTVDRFVHDYNLARIDFIKIDVEGFEPKVFEGMKEVIREFNPKILFEFNSFALLAFGRSNPFDFLEWIDLNFNHKFILTRDLESGAILIEAPSDNFATHFLHENIVNHGSVDNFLVYN